LSSTPWIFAAARIARRRNYLFVGTYTAQTTKQTQLKSEIDFPTPTPTSTGTGEKTAKRVLFLYRRKIK